MTEQVPSKRLSTETIASLYNLLRPYPSESQVTECLKELLDRRAADEPAAELSALRHFAEWAKGAKCDDEYAPRMVRHIAAVAADVLEGVADIAGYPAGIGASQPPANAVGEIFLGWGSGPPPGASE
jgi:hypothetical protein